MCIFQNYLILEECLPLHSILQTEKFDFTLHFHQDSVNYFLSISVDNDS